MSRARLRIAIIGCEPRDSIKFSYGNKKEATRHLIRKKIEAFGKRYQPIVHWPVRDIDDFPTTKNIDAVIIPGSPLNVDEETLSKMEWMRKLLDFISDVHERVPMLGICFGHQAVARVFGSEIRRYTKKLIFYEIGFEPTRLTEEGKGDPLFNSIPERFDALYSHFCYVKDTPNSSVVLAESVDPRNKSIQAYRVGSSTYGVQFHPDYSEYHISELVKNRNAIIMKNIPERKIKYFTKERHDHKVLENFLRII